MPGDDQYECIAETACTSLEGGHLDSDAKKCVEAGKCETVDHYTLTSTHMCVKVDNNDNGCGTGMVGDNVTGSPTYGQCIDIPTCQAEAEEQCGDDEKWIEGNKCIPHCNNHGTWNGERCECTAPYVPTDDSRSCVLECGDEAEYDSEKDQCDCKEEDHVFVENDKTCVPDCDKHGEWKDDACVCELGYARSTDNEHCDAHDCNEEGKIWRDGDGACIPDCDMHGEWDGAEDKCVCELGYARSNDKLHCDAHACDVAGTVWSDEAGICVPDCDMHGEWDGAEAKCVCEGGFDLSTD